MSHHAISNKTLLREGLAAAIRIFVWKIPGIVAAGLLTPGPWEICGMSRCCLLPFIAMHVTAIVCPAQSPLAEVRMAPYAQGLRTLECVVGDKPAKLIFDSGGGLTVFTKEFAASCGWRAFGRISCFRYDGQRLDSQRLSLPDIRVGATRLGLVAATMFDLAPFMKGAPPFDGLVALDAFDDCVVTIDYAAGKLTLESAASLTQRTVGMTPLRIRLGREAGGAALDVFVEVRAPGGSLWLELDSGNAGPVFLSPHAFAQLALSAPEKSAPTTLVFGGGATYACRVAQRDGIYDGLLNTAFFENHVVTLDLRNQLAWVKTNAPGK